MKFLLPLLRNNILQLSHANQLRYADTKNRTKTITLYMYYDSTVYLNLFEEVQKNMPFSYTASPLLQNNLIFCHENF